MGSKSKDIINIVALGDDTLGNAIAVSDGKGNIALMTDPKTGPVSLTCANGVILNDKDGTILRSQLGLSDSISVAEPAEKIGKVCTTFGNLLETKQRLLDR